MKKHFAIVAFFTLAATVLVSCEKQQEAEKEKKAYDSFVIKGIEVNTGSKLHWETDGVANFLFWDAEGDDNLQINGVEFYIVGPDTDDGAGDWRTMSTSGGVGPIDDKYFYICYKGNAGEVPLDLEFLEGNRYGFGGDATQTIPLVSVTEDNNITLRPACALLRVIASSYVDVIMGIKDETGMYNGSDFVWGGIVDPSTALFISSDAPIEAYDVISPSGALSDPASGVYTFILPMAEESVTVEGFVFYLDGEDIPTTPESIKIERGHLYNVDLRSN